MRAVAIVAVSVAFLLSGEAWAQDGKSATAGEQEARWDACYKETRLIHRTRNTSQESYRAMIKEARKLHMQICMARAISPRPIVSAEISEKKRPSTIAGWSANP